MTDDELEMFQNVGYLVAALERIAETECIDLECCKRVAQEALDKFNNRD